MNVNDNHIGCTIFFPELYYISSFWSRIQGRYFSCVWRFNLLTHHFFFIYVHLAAVHFFFKVFRSSRISTYCRSSVIYSNLFLLDFFFFHFPSPLQKHAPLFFIFVTDLLKKLPLFYLLCFLLYLFFPVYLSWGSHFSL